MPRAGLRQKEREMASQPARAWATPLSEILAPDRNSFGVLRLIAALAVVVSHSFYLASGDPESEPLLALTGHTLGQHAVHVFFTMSGLLVAASLAASGSVTTYLRARALRLVPGLVVCLLLTTFVAGPLLTELGVVRYLTSMDTYRYLVATLLLTTAADPLPGVFVHNPVPLAVNIPIWTLKYEVMCYLALALTLPLGLLRSRVGTTLALLPLLVASPLASALPGWIVPTSSLASFLRLAFSFALGVLAFTWRDRLPLDRIVLGCLWLLMALLLGTRLQGPACQVFAGYLALWLAKHPMGRLGALTQKCDLSYGIYIYGWLIAQALLAVMPGLSQPELLLYVIASLLPLALISWELIERPALAFKKVRSRKPKALLEPGLAKPAIEPKPEVRPEFPVTGIARDRLGRIASGRTVPAGL